MPLKAQLPQKTQRELIPTGNYPARVYEIIELGTVDSTWMGEAKKTHKVRIGFELPTEKRVFDETKGEQPMVISKEMALSFGDLAGLRKIIEAVEGRKITDAEAVNYDVLEILGKPLLVTVSHSEPNEQGIVYANATTFSPLIKGLTVEPLINKPRVLTYENWDENVYNSLPEFLKEKMNKTPEFLNRGKTFQLPVVNVPIEKTPTNNGEVEDYSSIPF